jgi:Fic family protein
VDRERFNNSPIGALVDISGIDGRFNVPYEHVAYVPHPLGIEPQLTAETWHAVGEANRSLARLDQASRLVANPAMLRRPTLRREAQSTSALEGTFAPLDQVLAADATDLSSRSRELREVLNYIEAADMAFDTISRRPRVTVALLESVHRILVRGTDADTEDAGRIRRVQVAIGSPTGRVEDARFVPMPPGIQLSAATQDLVDWIHTGQEQRDPVVGAALAHYQFETLHPFNDGNGRIGRLAMVLQLMVDGVISEPLLSVSPWFEARPDAYKDHLAEVSASGNWDGWVQFFAAGVSASAIDTAQRVNRLLAVQSRYARILLESNLRGVIRDIADALVGDPVITVSMMASRFEKTSPAIASAIQKLIDLGILLGPFGTYGRQYMAQDVWRAITAAPGAVPAHDAPLEFELAGV